MRRMALLLSIIYMILVLQGPDALAEGAKSELAVEAFGIIDEEAGCGTYHLRVPYQHPAAMMVVVMFPEEGREWARKVMIRDLGRTDDGRLILNLGIEEIRFSMDQSVRCELGFMDKSDIVYVGNLPPLAELPPLDRQAAGRTVILKATSLEPGKGFSDVYSFEGHACRIESPNGMSTYQLTIVVRNRDSCILVFDGFRVVTMHPRLPMTVHKYSLPRNAVVGVGSELVLEFKIGLDASIAGSNFSRKPVYTLVGLTLNGKGFGVPQYTILPGICGVPIKGAEVEMAPLVFHEDHR